MSMGRQNKFELEKNHPVVLTSSMSSGKNGKFIRWNIHDYQIPWDD
jgi:hypothetical protein